MKKRSMLRRGAALMCAFALMTPLVSACSGGGSGSGKGTVVWSTWGTPDELKVYEKFNEEFMKRHEDIKVVFQPVASYSEYHSKLQTQLTSNTAPDVFYVGDDHIASMVDNQVLMPLDDKLASSDTLKKDDFEEEIYRVASRDGKLYALPNDVNPDALWYDYEALKAVGITEDPAELAKNNQWTTDKFIEMTHKLKEAGMSGAIFWNYWATHDSWITSQGGKVYDESGAYVANKDPNSIDAMKKLADAFQNDGFVVADTMPKGDDADTQFVTHKAGFLVQGRYTVATVEGSGQDISNYNVVRWPTPDGKAAPTGVAASFLAINAKAGDADAAYTFFSEFLNQDGQRLRLSDSGNAVPSVKGIENIVTDAGKPSNVATLLEMRDLGYSNYPSEAVIPGLSGEIAEEHMLKMYQGKVDAQTTLNNIAKLVEEKTKG